jgi:predicted dehydrogenase
VNRELSGGELLHEVHELDLLCWLLGDVDSVFARASNLAHPELPNYDDATHLSLQFENGAMATLETGTAYHRPAWECLVSGTDGALLLDLRAATLTRFEAGDVKHARGVFDDEPANESLETSARATRRPYNTASTEPPYWMVHAVDLEVRNVVEHFRSGTPSPLAEARELAVTVAEAARESIRCGASVRPSDVAALAPQ